jgi:FkbM family methyltransferase
MTQSIQKIQQDLQKILQVFQDKQFQPYQVKKIVEGIPLDFIIADSEAQKWYDSSSSNLEDLSLEMKFLKEKMIQPEETIFECGTHHGYTTILLSSWANKGQIIGFEINPTNAKIAKQNIDINHINNVVIEQKGLGNQAGKVKIFLKSNSAVTPQNLLSFGWLRNLVYGLEEVEIISLDSYVEKSGIVPTFLKLDVEGYETEVLKGAKNILQKAPKLEIEIHTEILPRHNTSVKEIFDLIDISRYQCWVQWDDLERPVEFDLQQEINKRVHLFAIPKQC